MKSLLIPIISILSIVIVGCHKDDYMKKNYIRGRLFLLDTLTQNSRHIPWSGRKVLLVENATDSLNYLYSDSTDKQGYFSFVLFSDAPRHFLLRFEDTLKGYHYYDTVLVEKGTDNAVLIACLDERKQNGFYYTTKDNNLDILPEVTLRLYSSATLAIINSPQEAVETLTSDKYGRIFKANILPGEYYLNAEKNIDTTVWHVSAKAVTIHPKGFSREDIVMSKKENLFNNGFIIALKDSANNVVAGASVSMYNNLIAATSNNPAYAIGSLTADNLGLISKFNLPIGQYYLNAYKIIDQTILYRRLKEVTLGPNIIISDTMLLRK